MRTARSEVYGLMVITFSVKKARDQLLHQGIVYTFRWRKRNHHGNDWMNQARNGNKVADVFVEFVKTISTHQQLKPFVKSSGFETLKDWRSEIVKMMPTQKSSTGYLYRVTLRQPTIEEVPKNRHGINGIEIYCQKCGALIADNISVMNPFLFKAKHGDFCPKCGRVLGKDYFMKSNGVKLTNNE